MRKIKGFYNKNIRYRRELDDRKKQYIEFLKTKDLSDFTIEDYKNQMYKIREMESVVDDNRNIENYTIKEISTVLESMQPSSVSSASVYKNRIIDYLKFCAMNGWCGEEWEIFKDTAQLPFLEKIVNKRKAFLRYIPEIHLYEAIENLYNPQDKMIILLLYAGIRGNKMINLINLKEENYDKHSKILSYIDYSDNNKIRIINCNEILANIIEETLSTDTYYCQNGLGRIGHSVQEFINTEYLIKPTIYNQKKGNIDKIDLKVENSALRNRINSVLSNWLNANSNHITTRSLFDSGIINNAVKYSIINYGRRMEEKEFVDFIVQSGLDAQVGYRKYKIFIHLYDVFKAGILFDEEM